MNIIQNTDNSFLKPRDAWDRLSMEEQAAMMKVAVQNGIFDLATIRQKYNEFAEGGSTDTDWSYNSWKKQIAEHMGIRPDEDNTYDYEAYFKKYPEEAWKMLKGDPTAHFSDEFKTVYHPTFSSKSIGNDGSIYSGVKNPKTNPQGLVGGTWSPDYHTFTMSPDGYRGPVSMDYRKWYLENAEDSGVQLREANGSLPIYDDIPWAGVLPTVTVTGNKHSIGGPLVEAAMNEYKHGGGIHIKPENKGKFTRLKERTGHSATWFKEHGTPAQKKMATFALNSRKWKHGDGGHLFDGVSENSQQMKIGAPYYDYTEEGHPLTRNVLIDDIVITPQKRTKSYNSNYTVGDYARRAGASAIRKKNRDAEELAKQFNSQNEMYSMSPVDNISGENIYQIKKDPKVIGLSPVDPVGEFVVATAALNPAFKAAETLGLYGLGRYGAKTGLEAEQNWARGTLLGREFAKAPVTVEGPLSEATAQIRTRLGDVEVDNPGLYYRQGTPEMVSDFVNKGVAEASQFPNPMFNQGELFYNFPKRKGFTLNFDRRGTNGLITTSENMVPASGDAMPMPLSEVDETITSRIPTEKITTKNATAYNWEPGYGYRKVAQEPSTVTWSEANNPTIAAAERGRRKLRRATNSSWNKERWSEAAPFENTNIFIEDLTRQVDEVPFNYSKTKAQLNAMGETAPRAPKKWKENGRNFTDYNTGLDVSIASDLGDKAYSTGIHEPIHYMTASSNGLDVGVARPVFGSNMDPVKLEFDANNSTLIPRGKRYQHFMVDYNNGLLPKINTQSWDYRHGNDYYLSKQENQTYLKEWFLTDVEPFLKNPNDAAEIERFLTMNPEVVENNYYVNTLMKENRPGTNKDYAKALSKMLYSILGTGATTTLLNK